jgi:beta-lactamase regulating signal transducer with metallopeptidase domain
MSLLLSVTILALAWFAAVNLVVTLAAVAAAPYVRRDGAVTLRLAPFVVSVAFSAALFVPVHLALERAGTEERFGILILGLASVAAALIVRGARRAFAVLRHAAILERAVSGATISLAGILRPRILIGRDARAALSDAELALAIAHERAHEAARDNLLRFVMYCVPDLFALTRSAGRLEAAWRAEAEHRADARAVNGDRARAATLASALIKVARLDVASRRSPVWSTFNEPTLLESRVRALLADDLPRARTSNRGSVLLAAVGGAAAAAWLTGVPVHLHHATELLIALLP